MIIRDVNYGWIIRYLHANTASFFFIFVYLHIARGLYYGSYKSPRTLPWAIGVVILVLIIATGFMGYIDSPTFIYIDISMCITPFISVQTGSQREENIVRTILSSNQIYPKAIWENLQAESTRKQVRSFLKYVTGVYIIINKINGKMYVGSAIKGQIYIRFYKHLLSGKGGSRLVFAAVTKYGLENFAFIVAETIPAGQDKEDNQDLLALEDHYLTLLKPAYNIAKSAGNTLGVVHTDETKAFMKLNYSSERREKIGALNRGKNCQN